MAGEGRSAGLIAVGLLMCLETALALRTGVRGIDHVIRRRDGASDDISVALLIVGRIENQVKDAKGQTSGNIVDSMTGRNDHDWDNNTDILVLDAGARRVSGWATIKEHVYEHLRSSKNVHADVFVCTDVVEDNYVPPEVKGVFTSDARDQFERAYKCYQRILDVSRSYDFFVKLRPDFVFLRDFPEVDMASMRRDRIHTRYRAAIGLPNLTSAMFSWNNCGASCNGNPKSAIGYINDDMINVVPSAIADRVFVPAADFRNFRSQCKFPENWLNPPRWPETFFTEALLGAGIQTEPLELVGYPIDSPYDHKSQARCAMRHHRKSDCGVAAR